MNNKYEKDKMEKIAKKYTQSDSRRTVIPNNPN